MLLFNISHLITIHSNMDPPITIIIFITIIMNGNKQWDLDGNIRRNSVGTQPSGYVRTYVLVCLGYITFYSRILALYTI